ncbi:MAG: GMC family oxidoreductase [Rhodobacteraceae bacterium]|nr:GMC family oxidoreductase [Paracoccaceae bacterium]
MTDNSAPLLAQILCSSVRSVARSPSPIDVAIVGSGPAGITSAIEIAKAGYSVVIFEAGPFLLSAHVGSMPFRSRDDLTPKLHEMVRYKTAWLDPSEVSDTKPPMLSNDAWSVVGGRSIFWGGCTPRFASWDFDDWPISAEDMAPYYRRAERLMHVSGNCETRPPFFQGATQDRVLAKLRGDGISASHARLGLDTQVPKNGHVPRGFDCAIDRLVRSGLLSKDVTRERITLVPNAPVDEVVAEERARGLVVSDPAIDRRYKISARHVVLAGGAVQSTRLALASGLDRLHPSVGNYIADHLFVQGLFKLKEPLDAPIYAFVDPTPERPFHVQVQGPFDETWYSPYHATVWLDCEQSGSYLLIYCFGVGEPAEDHKLVLRESSSDAPGELGNYYVLAERTEKELATLQEMEAFLPVLADSMGAECIRSQVNPAGAALHEIGGLRMAASPRDGAVDPSGHFHEIENLSVADAAAWPSQGSANSYLTIVAWSLCHADEVIKRLGRA